jgi:glycine cleavage system H protein
MHLPNNLKYTAEHEWLLEEHGTATIGVTTFAADALGDVVYVELPAVGSSITAGQVCGEIESTKSVSDLYAPADGEVLETNHAVVDDPSLLNSDPFDEGWLFRMKITNSGRLLDADGYRALTEGG